MQFNDNFGQIHAYFTVYITYNMLRMIVHVYKYSTLVTRQRDVVVVRTALTAAVVVSSTMIKVYDPHNSETRIDDHSDSTSLLIQTRPLLH